MYHFRSEYEEDPIPPPLTPAPAKDAGKREIENQVQSKPMPTIIPSFTIPAHTLQNQQNATSNNQIRPGMPSIPLPLLILNSLQPQQANQEKKEVVSSSSGNSAEKIPNNGKSNFSCYLLILFLAAICYLQCRTRIAPVNSKLFSVI